MKPLHYGKNVLFIDYESTGVFGKNYTNLDITEVGLKLYECYGTKNQTITSYESLYRPTGEISPTAQRITGITHDMVANKLHYSEDFDTLNPIIQKADIIVVHGGKFDIKAIQTLGIDITGKKVFDTYTFAKLIDPGHDRYGMSHLAARYDIKVSDAHRAMGDVEMMIALYAILTTPHTLGECWTTFSNTKSYRSGSDFTYTLQGVNK